MLRHFAIAIFAALLCLAPASAAPAPLGRRPTKVEPLHLWGKWIKHWGGSRYLVCFYHDGTYEAGYPEQDPWWVGTWRVEGRTLTVRERHRTSPPEYGMTWRVTLDGAMSGEGTYDSSRVSIRMWRPFSE